jgi:YegS/Rv2252/BmrU family lipid kinase
MKKISFIINSRIGQKKIDAILSAINKYLPSNEVDIAYTQYGGHAIELAKKSIDNNCNILVAVGGDGTVNELLQVVMHSSCSLAVVPTGSGNGLARHCNIPLDIELAVKNIAEGKIEKIDIGKANDKYFISNAGVGFDAYVCNFIQQTKHRGLKMYARFVIQKYFSYKPETYTIETETETFIQKAFFLNIANGREFGYGFEIAPNASLQDGLLDMILVKKITPLNGFKFVWDGWNKKITSNKQVIHLKAKKIKITAPGIPYFQTDGDAHNCKNECTIEVITKALQIIVPLHVDNL